MILRRLKRRLFQILQHSAVGVSTKRSATRRCVSKLSYNFSLAVLAAFYLFTEKRSIEAGDAGSDQKNVHVSRQKREAHNKQLQSTPLFLKNRIITSFAVVILPRYCIPF